MACVRSQPFLLIAGDKIKMDNFFFTIFNLITTSECLT